MDSEQRETAKVAPGPWAVEAGGARLVNTQVHIISAADGLGPVAYSTRDNAAAIAAVPELLEAARALEGLCAWLLHRFGTDCHEATEAQFRLAIARAALAKAGALPAPPLPSPR